MMLIESFTNSHIDNILSCLRLRPDKMVMVGNADEMREPVKRYEKLLAERGLATRISECDVYGKDLREICNALYDLVRAEEDCVIDLTGGDELVMMAVGAMLAGMEASERQRIRVEKLDRHTGRVFDCMNRYCALPGEAVALTVDELLALHGGVLHPSTYQPPMDCSYKDLERLWRMASGKPKKWNQSVAVLNEFESWADSKMQVYLPLEYVRGDIHNFYQNESLVREFLERLQHCGVIADQSNRYALEYTYTSPMMRHCLEKAGNMLEVKTLLEGRAVKENGKPFFQDCRMGVNIDWDGIIYDPEEQVPETRNEIDVLLIHDATPLFISCKNGNVQEDELFKLHTVATRFGGPNARKMLIATDLDGKNPASVRALIQRAWDMDIIFVTDVAELSHEQWQQILMRAVQ